MPEFMWQDWFSWDTFSELLHFLYGIIFHKESQVLGLRELPCAQDSLGLFHPLPLMVQAQQGHHKVSQGLILAPVSTWERQCRDVWSCRAFRAESTG